MSDELSFEWDDKSDNRPLQSTERDFDRGYLHDQKWRYTLGDGKKGQDK